MIANQRSSGVREMSMPGFSAEVSLHRSKGHYRTAGTFAPAEGRIFLALSSGSLEALAALASDAPQRVGESRDSSIVQMSVPGHRANLSGQCSACKSECYVIAEGCEAAGYVACSPLLAASWFFGAGLVAYGGCVAVATAACVATADFCLNQCNNIGSACCPVACGNSCCNYSETCLDSRRGLCCSAGTMPCPGPQESCYDPTKEKCQPSGVGCPYGKECGNNCCGEDETCVDPDTGNCCGILSGIPCLNECCDSSTQRCTDTGCCPTAQACNGLCCASNQICGPNGECIAAKTCPPGEFLCVSDDRKTQNCCTEYQNCWPNGSCSTFVG
jgi:hypothetical protein